MSFERHGSFPPHGYVRWRQGVHVVVALEDTRRSVVGALEGAGTLYRWAAEVGERSIPGGRGPIHVARLGDRTVAVRHYRRGGWMAPLLGDRYIDHPPRPFAELDVSERLRDAGVTTPRIVAGVVSDARPGYRADLATRWLSPGHDLETLLTPNVYPEAARRAGLEAAGRTVGLAHKAGLDHPDLNAGNLFLMPRGSDAWDAALLDLDRARVDSAASGTHERNLARLWRSLGKARRAGRVSWSDADRAAFRRGYEQTVRG